MSTPSIASRSGWKGFLSVSMAMIASAIFASIGTYFATKYANFATSENDQAMRYIDYQVTNENNATSFFKIPGVKLLLKDEKGNTLNALSLVKIDLQNFSEHDISNTMLQIEATSDDNIAPILQTFRVGNGPAEDTNAEKNLEQVEKGNTRYISIHLNNVNRTENILPNRTILLYFKGATAPKVVISANATGVTARPFAYQHYLDSQYAHRSFIQTYGNQIFTTLIFSIFVIYTIWLISSGRRREVANIACIRDIIENSIQGIQNELSTQKQPNDIAKDIAFTIWKGVYQRASIVTKWLSVTPDKSKL